VHIAVLIGEIVAVKLVDWRFLNPRYCIIVNGENFPIRSDAISDDEVGKRWGFFTTRVVNARNEAEAVRRAQEKVLEELSSQYGRPI
jgi:hypothetical protein